jgi:hypothetical protein
MPKPPTFVIALFSISLSAVWTSADVAQPVVQTSTSTDSQDAAETLVSADVEAAASPAQFRQSLARHRPVYRFDSDEDFFPLAVNAITNNTGNRLERDNDVTLARRHADGSGFNIGWLRFPIYPSGDAALESDKVVERHGSSDPDADYLRDARRLYRNHNLRNRIYGHIHYRRNDQGGIIGAWLQYWVFYYYNSFHVGPFGKHEGDWEMIQIQVDRNARPLRAAYAQHNTGSLCNWNHIERTGSGDARPVVYVGGGSHASYYTAGSHNVPDVPGGDRADGNGRHLSGVHLRTIGAASPRWVEWPGFWGGTKSTIPQIPTESPRGPAFQGDKWGNPDQWARDVDGTDHCK